MALPAVIVGSCLFAVASAQFYLPSKCRHPRLLSRSKSHSSPTYLSANNAQKYVRPRLEQVKTDQKRDPVAATGNPSRLPDGLVHHDQQHAEQREVLRQLLASTNNFHISDGQSGEATSTYQEKKNRVMCYLLLQIFDEKVEHILAEEEGEKNGTKEDQQLSKQRADEAVAFINQHLATLDYCSQYYGHD